MQNTQLLAQSLETIGLYQAGGKFSPKALAKLCQYMRYLALFVIHRQKSSAKVYSRRNACDTDAYRIFG